MKSLDMTNASGKKALDAAVKYATNGYFANITAAINQMVADCKNLSADNFLLQKCGINLSNTDVGAITGYDAGGSTIKTKASVVPESGKLDTTFNATSFETNGLTFKLTKSNLTSNEAYMWRALKTWWGKEGLNLIEKSFGYSFNDSDALAKEIYVVFKNESSRSYLAYMNFQKNNGEYKLTLNINKTHFKSFASTDVNGISTSYSSYYLDRTIAHEFTHAVMMAKVNNYDDLPTFITEGLAELTRGIDDLRSNYIKTLAADYTKLQKYLNVKSPLTGANAYAAGYIFLRYLAKQGSENYSTADVSDFVTTKSTALTLSKNFSEKVLDLDDYSSKIKTVKANALTSGIMIYGNDNANSILTGAGKDTLIGGKGNDTLAGGSGADIFIYSEGNDVITDWAADDKISLTAELSKTTLSGSDVVFTIVDGSLTLKNAKGKTINVVTSDGEQYSTVLGGNALTLSNAATSPVTIDSAIKTVDGSSRTKATNITANKSNNSISGGSKGDVIYGGAGKDSIVGNAGNDSLYGEAGNDTLIGGKGNDTLTGGAGTDVFFYTAGNDVITDYTADDKISVGAAISNTTLDGSDVVFTVGKGSLTVKNAKGKTLNVIPATGTRYSTVLGSTTLNLTNAASSSVTVDAAVKKIDASTRTKAISITGNANANKISGSSGNDKIFGAAGKDSLVGGAGNDELHGGRGNDTLVGGAGNDSLWGDAGADKFICGEGDDIIFGFDDKDTLTLDGINFKTSYDTKSGVVAFSFSGGSVTLQDFTATTFHVNDITYQISSKKFVKK